MMSQIFVIFILTSLRLAVDTNGAFIPSSHWLSHKLPQHQGFPSPKQGVSRVRPRLKSGLAMRQLTKEEAWTAVGDAVRYLKEHESPKPFISGILDFLPSIHGPSWTLEPNCDSMTDAPFSTSALKALYEDHLSQSPVGKGMDTVMDLEARKSREVAGGLVSLKSLAGNWTRVIEGICRQVEEQMSPTSRVQADWYKMLLYGEGDFFEVHKDTQRPNDHFASLLVFLPTEYTGGDFLLHDDGDFDGDRFNKETQDALGHQQVRWIAFYSDIVHSVKPVVSGYRLALAYNLRRHETGERFKKDGLLAPPLQRLVDGMKEHFNSPQANESWVFQLQHEYTLSSMTPAHLKGIDSALYQLLSTHFDCDIRLLCAYQWFDDDPKMNLVDEKYAGEMKKIAAFYETGPGRKWLGWRHKPKEERAKEREEKERMESELAKNLPALSYQLGGDDDLEALGRLLLDPRSLEVWDTARSDCWFDDVYSPLQLMNYLNWGPERSHVYQLRPAGECRIPGTRSALGYNLVTRRLITKYAGNEGTADFEFQYITVALVAKGVIDDDKKEAQALRD
ncbi:unnamed protein product [Vitrella brassicaformis CCMP3155]|uniref:Fe2OG dioxygenase domain-containing protein n=1 Tax=Vitrella brassicaformis (strain CCMP3155) TaxID=1169540 RepID=A0A0G4G3H4_VITBC|nr:unnamed protein product [Vitrella brassicaformis CCMP3155]|eukprot:CEM22602.1 unnamed protein product [Vitrella brassicaformis CCMP3155]